MKPNRSLALSARIQECKTGNILGVLEQEFPSHILEEVPGGRNRVFNEKDTLLTMVLTAVQQDKTLKNSVDLFYMIHQRKKQELQAAIQTQMNRQRSADRRTTQKKAGRPRKYEIRLPKSLDRDISLNTAAYSKARGRVPKELTEKLFQASRLEEVENAYSHWHGHRVLIGDGTYVQMQDTEALREDFQLMHHGQPSEGYPQGLLEAIIDRGTGQVYSFRLSNRHVSELALFYELLDEVPSGSLLLLDDLYNCYEILAKCARKGIEVVLPAKRERTYKRKEVLAEGDEIIEIKAPKTRSKWLETNEKAESLSLRRIVCLSPEGKEYVLHTTILDKSISQQEFQMLYLTRWDIEITIREIKTIMDVHILRSKTPEMVSKELTVSLATYNLIRKIIYASIKDLPFSPKEGFLHQFYTLNTALLVDKKGRVYNRWSTGRRRATPIDTPTGLAEPTTESKL